jgi:hypothetical protein
MLPSISNAPYFNCSQAHTYTIARTKNPAVNAKKMLSLMLLSLRNETQNL